MWKNRGLRSPRRLTVQTMLDDRAHDIYTWVASGEYLYKVLSLSGRILRIR